MSSTKGYSLLSSDSCE
uniref:Uncharacterized protein n=1 Tax=Arundo donax TaxID=35708 RepID=A0A0A9I2G1_ARUDO